MPEITLYRNQELIPNPMVRELATALRTAVAQLLSDPTNPRKLTREQVKVRVTNSHELDDNMGDLEVRVSIKDFQFHDVWTVKTLDSLTAIIRTIVPDLVGNPARPIDTWLELNLGNTYGQKIWDYVESPAKKNAP